jgi:hypothetical protein
MRVYQKRTLIVTQANMTVINENDRALNMNGLSVRHAIEQI